VDVAIRNTTGPTPGLECRKLLDIRPVPLCTRTLRDQLGAPSDLAGQTLIHVSARPNGWARWLTAVGCKGLRAKRDLTFDSASAALEAAAHGRGIVLTMDPITWDVPVARELVRAFPHRVEGTASYYLVFRKADLARRQVRALVDWLHKGMTAYKRNRWRERDGD
jgi:LysR family glycine cleavage system transcriptional activator